MEYVREEEYLNMLNVLGSNLREWLTNVNDLHTHLRSSLPHAIFPEFWCVDDEDEVPGVESMILHYYSQRGSAVASLNVGIVKEVAKYFFNLKIEMIRIATQGVEDSEFTSWRIITKGCHDVDGQASAKSETILPTQYESRKNNSTVKCPFSNE